MTIDDRVDALMRTLPHTTKSEAGVAGFRERLKTALWEIARDQRETCRREFERDLNYVRDMKDAGRGHLLREDQR